MMHPSKTLKVPYLASLEHIFERLFGGFWLSYEKLFYLLELMDYFYIKLAQHCCQVSLYGMITYCGKCPMRLFPAAVSACG